MFFFGCLKNIYFIEYQTFVILHTEKMLLDKNILKNIKGLKQN